MIAICSRPTLMLALALAGAALAAGCTPYPPQPQKTQLEVRQIQTRTYDNRKGQFVKIMKAVINVLQDEGYIIKNADKELGFITATREIDLGTAWDMSFSVFALGAAGSSSEPRYQKNKILEASVNVSEFGQEVKVRVIFQSKVLDNLGGIVSVEQLESPEFYQDFFAKVDKGIFLEKQNL